MSGKKAKPKQRKFRVGRPRQLRMSVRTRLIAGFTLAIVLIGSGGVAAAVTLRSIGENSYRAVSDISSTHEAIAAVQIALGEVRVQGSTLGTLTEMRRDSAWSEQEENIVALHETFAAFQQTFESAYGV